MEVTVSWTGNTGARSGMGFLAETGSGHEPRKILLGDHHAGQNGSGKYQFFYYRAVVLAYREIFPAKYKKSTLY